LQWGSLKKRRGTRGTRRKERVRTCRRISAGLLAGHKYFLQKGKVVKSHEHGKGETKSRTVDLLVAALGDKKRPGGGKRGQFGDNYLPSRRRSERRPSPNRRRSQKKTKTLYRGKKGRTRGGTEAGLFLFKAVSKDLSLLILRKRRGRLNLKRKKNEMLGPDGETLEECADVTVTLNMGGR